jgi:hypothetical protein
MCVWSSVSGQAELTMSTAVLLVAQCVCLAVWCWKPGLAAMPVLDYPAVWQKGGQG